MGFSSFLVGVASVGAAKKSRGTKKGSDPYVFVEGKAPDGSYFGANYKKSQLPALYQSLLAAGVQRVVLDDTTEVDLTTVQQRGSGAKAPQTDAQVSRAYDEIWDEMIGSGKEWSDETPNIVYGLLSSRLSSTRMPHQNVAPAEARRVLHQIGDFMDAESEWGPDTLEEVEAILRRTRRGSAARGGSRARFRSPHAGPSIKRMVDFLKLRKEDAASLKTKMDAGDRRSSILEAADRMLNGNGVEYIAGVGGGLSYVNMGDTYDTTLLYDEKSNRFVVASWGDIVENQPRRFRD